MLSLLGFLNSFPWLIPGIIATVSDTPSAIGNYSAQGLLALGLGFLAKEYKDEKNKREALNEKLLTEVVPLLTRSTEAVERITYLYREAIDSPPQRRSRPKAT